MEKIFSGHEKNRKSFSEYISEQKVKIPNKGDLAEAILACGVAAKFFDPTAVVTKVSIEKMLGKVLSTRKTKLERGDMSAKTTVKVSDTITLSVGIRAREWEFISDRKNWPLIEWQFTSVAKYCNTYKRLLRYASILYRNNKENKIVAGTPVFQTKNVVHVQYIASNSKKNILGSLDFLFYKLITDVYSKHKYFDFGTSNESDGKKINQGLMYWKEGFGARSLTQNFYKFDISSIGKIKSLFL